MALQAKTLDLPKIPVLEVRQTWPVETLDLETERANALLDEATAGYPSAALRVADAISKRWLSRHHNPYLDEIGQIAARLRRPGGYYFNVSYEWGCTTSVGPSPDGASARLMRVLDWPTSGIGRYVIAAAVDSSAGRWITLTWPGYTGVLQAVAPGRFAAALNQAPMTRYTGLLALDWAIGRARVWRTPHRTPAQLLRYVFETATTYQEARQMLTETPIASPTIYTLSGLRPDDACIIERKEQDGYVIAGPASAANAWQCPNWTGRARGEHNEGRCQMMAGQAREFDTGFAWLRPPILNDLTRLVFVADAASGRLIAQGYEVNGPATQVLSLGS